MELLNKDRYEKVKPILDQALINTLFAAFVVEQHVNGSIYADRLENPESFYIVHPYGMSLLIGSTGNPVFNRHLTDYLLNIHNIRNRPEWLQAYPGAWTTKLANLLGDRLIRYSRESDNQIPGVIVENTRVNFTFNKTKYLDFKKGLGVAELPLIRVDRNLFGSMEGAVIPRYFWDNADDFCRYGIGFCLVLGDQPVSMAYSAYITERQLELGIETREDYRGKGLALHACSALIDYCLEHDYEPVWSCRLENTGSFRLAQKLGFEPVLTLPYYKLP